MQQSDLPSRFNVPFANAAGASYIRSIPDAHVAASGGDAPASLADGFPPECFLPESSGGIPPNGKDFNGILKRLSEWARWQAAGGPSLFNSAFCTAIGGYPKGALLASTTPGVLWMSTAEGNTTDPDGLSPANWTRFGTSSYQTDIAGNWKRTTADGFVEMGGVYTGLPGSETSFSMTFPFSGFPTSCLGLTAMVRNTSLSNGGLVSIQEVSLSATTATLYAQNHNGDFSNAAGGMRWRAWGV